MTTSCMSMWTSIRWCEPCLGFPFDDTFLYATFIRIRCPLFFFDLADNFVVSYPLLLTSFGRTIWYGHFKGEIGNLFLTRASQEKTVNGFIADFRVDGREQRISRAVVHSTNSAPMSGRRPACLCLDPSGLLTIFCFGYIMLYRQHERGAGFWSFRGDSVESHTSAFMYCEYPNGGPPFLDLSSMLPGDGVVGDLTIRSNIMDTTDGNCATFRGGSVVFADGVPF